MNIFLKLVLMAMGLAYVQHASALHWQQVQPIVGQWDTQTDGLDYWRISDTPTLLEIPPRSSVIMLGVDKLLAWEGRGNGLFVPLTLSVDGQKRLRVPPASYGRQLWLQRATSVDERASLLMVNDDAPIELNAFRRVASTTLPGVSRKRLQGDIQTWWPVSASGETWQFNGPTTVKLRYAAIMPSTKIPADMAFSWRLDDGPFNRVDVPAREAPTDRELIDGCAHRLTPNRFIAIDIPAGKHQLHLQSSDRLLVRPMMEGPGLALPSLNASLEKYLKEDVINTRKAIAAPREPQEDVKLFWRSLVGHVKAGEIRYFEAPAKLSTEPSGPLASGTDEGAIFPLQRFFELKDDHPLLMELPTREDTRAVRLVLTGLPEDSEVDIALEGVAAERQLLLWRPQWRNTLLQQPDRRMARAADPALSITQRLWVEGVEGSVMIPPSVTQLRLYLQSKRDGLFVSAAYRAERPVDLNEELMTDITLRHSKATLLAWLRTGGGAPASDPSLPQALRDWRAFLQKRSDEFRQQWSDMQGVPSLSISPSLFHTDPRLGIRVHAGHALFGKTETERAQGWGPLATYYAEHDSRVALQSMLSAVWVVHGDRKVLPPLIESYLLGGDEALAWLLGWLAGSAGVENEAFIAASVRARQFESATQAALTLSAPRQAFWLGHVALAQQQIEQAQRYWHNAGQAGAEWLQRLQEARQVSEALQQPTVSADTFAQWAEWSQRSVGTPLWRNHDEGGRTGAGGTLLPDRQSRPTILMNEVTPDQPLAFSVAGPATLRLVLRPVHPAGRALQGLDDWIDLQLGNARWRLPVLSNNKLAQLPRYQGGGHYGETEYIEFSVGPGITQVGVHSQTYAYAARLQRKENLLEIPFLPSISAGLQNVLKSREVVESARITYEACQASSMTGETYRARAEDYFAQESSADGGRPPAGAIAWHSQDDIAPQTGDALSMAVADYWRYMNADPTNTENRRAQLLASLEKAPPHPWIAVMKARAIKSDKWALIDGVVQSGGMVRKPADLPLLSVAQDRSTYYTPTLQKNQQTVSTLTKRLELTLSEPTRLRATLVMHRLPYAVAGSSQVNMQLNDSAARVLTLSPQASSRTLEWSLPVGTHLFRYATPEINSDYRLTIEWQRWVAGQWEPLSALPAYRNYLLSQQDQPVKVYFEHDQWLRVDIAREKGIERRWMFASGPGYWTLPHEGEATRLVRIYALQSQQSLATFFNGAPALNTDNGIDVRPPAEPALRSTAPLPAFDAPAHYTFYPQFRPGGTWSVGLGYQPALDNASDDQAKGEFSEMQVQYRRRFEEHETYYRADAIAREHAQASMAVGVRQWFDWVPENTPWRVNFAASVFHQEIPPYPDSPAQEVAVDAWQLSAQVDYWTHYSTQWDRDSWLRLWGRDDSVPEAAKGQGSLDSEIWTGWKESHKKGIQVGDSWIYSPWLDQEIIAEAMLWSDPDVSALDSVEAGLGWRQYINASVVSARLSQRRYLETDYRDTALNSPHLTVSWAGRFGMARHGSLGWRIGADRNLRTDANEWNVSVFWHWDALTGLSDVRPQELPFRELYEVDRREDAVMEVMGKAHE